MEHNLNLTSFHPKDVNSVPNTPGICMPNLDDLREVKAQFFNIAGFPNRIGCVDGSHIPIQSPGGEQAELFRNRKGFFSINVQVVCDAKLYIRDTDARWHGSIHDSTVYHNSFLRARLDNNEIDDHLLGDSAYPCGRFMMTPILNPTTNAERRYNQSAQIKTRNTVERTFGVWKRRFACLSQKIKLKLDHTLAVIVATAVLHNIALQQNDTAIIDSAPEEDIVTEPTKRSLSSEGNHFRRLLLEQYFSLEIEKAHKKIKKKFLQRNNITEEELEPVIMAKLDEHTHRIEKKLQALQEKLEQHNSSIETQIRTYAAVATTTTTKSKGPEKPSATQSIMVKSKNAIDSRFATNEEREKAKKKIAGEGTGLVVEVLKNRNSLLVLKGVSKDINNEETVAALRNQNSELFSGLDPEDDHLSIKYRKKTRNPQTTHIVLSTSPILWRKITGASKVNIDLRRVVALDQSPLVQCTRCLGYGHSKKYCSDKADLCSHCGGQHTIDKCTKRQASSPPSSINCQKSKQEKTEHNAFSETCPVRRRWGELARSTTAYL
ncbi:unnamed protein product [Euphydryas editha]|uniref:DDE Tnp4 domain-containing protein n=1 Tax=Euphydryas editha TaxID=104508 RepID=A0AAU9VBI4_EUPED|nr:unnamed protein product [Euphydryas editha]